MGILLTDNISQITNAHKRAIANLVEQNPNATLLELAAKLNDTPEMMTCHVTITPEILDDLGYLPPTASPPSLVVEPAGAEATKHRTLSVEILRKQLEIRHDRIQQRIESLLEEDLISQSQLKTIDMLAKIDDSICNKLMDLMAGEAAPTLPQAIIITCLRRLGVADEDIQVIEDFRVA